MLCQRLTTDRAIARIERNVGYGGDGEKAFVMQEWHWRFLRRVRGPGGGYVLAREQRRITADDVLRAARTVIVEREEPVSESVLLVEERRRTHLSVMHYPQ